MGGGLDSILVRLGDSSPSSLEENVKPVALFVALLCACIVIGHLLENTRWLNESVTALIIGLVTGIIILCSSEGKSSRIFQFDGDLFFIYLLPPIIFNAGFQVKKKQFFRNFMTITLFGAAGTLISFCVIALGTKLLFEALGLFSGEGEGSLGLKDYLALGAIFSATDSVCTLQVLNQDETPLLYSLVFGEGVVNDATSVVLFKAIQKFDLNQISPRTALNFFGNFFSLLVTSTLLGVVVGLVCAYVIKKLYFGRHSTDREVALMILMAYLSYITAQFLDLSGILTVFFCGIVMSHYTWYNVTQRSRVTTKHSFATMSFIAETFIFVYVGMDALDIDKWKFVKSSPGKSVGTSALLLGLVMVARALFIFPLSFVSNLARKSKSDKLNRNQQFTIWWAGLMRGAVSMALAYNQFTSSTHTLQPANAVIITSTITVVLFSTVVFGSLTKPLIKLLLPTSAHLTSPVTSEPSSPKSFLLPLLSNEHQSEGGDSSTRDFTSRPSLRMLLSTPTYTVHHYWRKFDDGFMRRVFGGRGYAPPVCGSSDEGSI